MAAFTYRCPANAKPDNPFPKEVPVPVRSEEGPARWQKRGRIWTLQRDYPRLAGPDEFRAWHEPGTVRVLFAHWVEPDGGGSTLVSEARVEPIDRRAAVRLRSLWMVIGVFERFIGGEALELAVERAERA